MRGSIFFCLNTQTYEAEVPESFLENYSVEDFNENGVDVNLEKITFKGLSTLNGKVLGFAVEVSIENIPHYVIEFYSSWLSDEAVSSLVLGKGLQYPSNSTLTEKEAQVIISKYRINELGN